MVSSAATSALPISAPYTFYPQARVPAPKKLVGLNAALEAQKNPEFEVKPEIFKEFSLPDGVAIVTGGNSGIGLEYSVCLAELGATVYCLDMPETPSEEFLACQSYVKRMPGNASLVFKRADVTDEETMNSLFQNIAETHGKIDVVIANAGVLGPRASCNEYPADWFRKVMDVNVTGVFITAQAASRQMIATKTSGSIIVTASMSGSIVNRDMPWCAYNASKAAAAHLVKSMAAELGQFEIRVNSISPGHIQTAMTDVCLDAEPGLGNQWAFQNPMGRLGGVSELRGVCAYLASSASSYTTGSDILVCGGHHVW
ncbi:hypothetical protein B0I73DRAFT_163729 [Yarrowia lipolytica]|jgi:NAD(P)-dependent dehydrogenase (short-subunit alcohol dehydrogenase family)|uniref:YALI0F01650p n=2 Tax=Yarrowia lipolytica TaxID=4952 RepID=Q6C392_YARLI|nr:YALI0F01650p [Yarrowia lipolytica CLIB122]AOW06498.1 hypothetical protein YALI1_F02545g [Yarrowia lipolytica]KAB8282182.1 hypothetical protein BKA91DRAFT_162889 [Yarrowia lipolytica]KAE8171959.1 hypothetical protein BKA90DRAFT_157572 [Yarrowia lipolytica]KAJ8056248.1 hypothetical protein LXG23DRAFT_48160 [Yarrowia lipolytica]QNQ01424.1 Sorbose reductase sou1 [Yarrowia lipolytica]|eukprot:XP_504870.1 YALI0F01650p [Yarrowia lipolytica CLIB122]